MNTQQPLQISLHPKIAELVRNEASQFGSKEEDLVNELLWLALRRGDIGRHFTDTKPDPQPDQDGN